MVDNEIVEAVVAAIQRARISEADPDRFWTYRELANRWPKDARTIRDMMRAGKIPGALRLGGTWAIQGRDLLAYEKSLKVGAR